MTLLSIREQEAVKNLRKKIIAGVSPTILNAGMAAGFASASEAAAAEVDGLITSVILATRDAIARQVRERAEGYKVLTPFTVAHDLATFIEGLRCE